MIFVRIYWGNTLNDERFASLLRIVAEKKYMAVLLFCTVASFGFEMTHPSLGIDDFGVDHYMSLDPSDSGNMLQQGRLLHLVFFYMLGLADVVPFFGPFLGACLLAVAALLLSACLEEASSRSFSWAELALFSALFISYPVVAFKFIYDIDVVVTMFSYACCSAALYMGLLFEKSGERWLFVVQVILLMASIGSYESFNAVFVCEVLFVLSLRAIYDHSTVRQIIFSGLKYAAALLLAIISYYAMVKFFQFVTENPAYARSNLISSGGSLWESVDNVVSELRASPFFFASEFVLSLVLLAVIYAVHLVRSKKPILLLIAAGVFVFCFFIPVIQETIYWRSCQTFAPVLAFTGLMLLDLLSSRCFFSMVARVFLAIVVVMQIRDLNLWFYKDWQNYQKNVFAINVIATDLVSSHDISKPVCFVNRDYDSFLMTWDESQTEIGESPIIASLGFLGEDTSSATRYLFEQQGYDFLLEPTPEQTLRALDSSEGMSAYPHDGYIKELEDIIIVNFGDRYDNNL